jgi:hypothetical protein
MEHARNGMLKVVMEAIRRAPPEEAPLLGWPVACGAKVAERTRALSYAVGVLRVEVPDAAWRKELTTLAPQYLATLRQFGVARIEFVVGASKS